MSIDEDIIAYVVRYNALSEVQRAGVSTDDFVDEYRTVWRYLVRSRRDHDATPSPDVLKGRFPDIEVPRVRKRDLTLLIHNVKERRKFIDFLTALNDTASTVNSPEDVNDAIQNLQSKLNTIGFTSRNQNHLVDLFSEDVTKRMKQDLADRRSGKDVGIPTGLPRLDMLAGGVRRQKMVTIIGRTGIGKSWLDLLLVANAVISGHRVILYPLEMSLSETAFRLYTLFTQQMFGVRQVLKNYDLTMGNVNMRKVTRFLGALEDKFAGQLYVADVASLADPYTVERIEAEVDIHKPDMFWVDYITLLKSPRGTVADEAGWQAVRLLSNGIAGTAKRRNTVGGCSAQVNREALKINVFLPRLEHISFGDSIGHDADMVISANRKGKYLYYALVKNRGGPEFGSTKVEFKVNEGILREVDRSAEEAEDAS